MSELDKMSKKDLIAYYNSETICKYLVCEFSHWDCCLTGLIKLDDQYFICKYAHDIESLIGTTDACYTLHHIKMEGQFAEYFEDYRKTFGHWFHANGKRVPHNLQGYHENQKWFSEKWFGKNPIDDNHSEPCDVWNIVNENWLDEQFDRYFDE